MENLSLEGRFRRALTAAMKRRDSVAMAACRSVLSAIANAEAVAQAPATPPGLPIAGAITGLGKGDVPRRQMAPGEIASIVQAEIDEREKAAADYGAVGHIDEAEKLHAEARIIGSVARGEDF